MKIKILLVLATILLFGYAPAFSGGVSGAIDSNGTWAGGTDGWLAEKGSRTNVSIYLLNSAVMTISLQKKFTGDAAWGEHEVQTWDLTAASTDQEYTIPNGGVEPEKCYYRLGCDLAGNYTSGNCTCRLGGGRK